MANRLTLVLATLLLATPAYAETVDGSRVIIIDGDTVNLPCPAATKGQRGCSERIRLTRCAANPAVQGRVKSADGKAVLVDWIGFNAASAAVRCTGE